MIRLSLTLHQGTPCLSDCQFAALILHVIKMKLLLWQH